jgi:hypothetical protein
MVIGRRAGRHWLGGLVVVAATALVAVGPAAPAFAALGRGGGYVWADAAAPPLNVTYTPMAQYQYNSTSPFAAINTIRRGAQGYYLVTFPGLLGDGVPHVTAYGAQPGYCDVNAIVEVAVGTQVFIHCVSAQGIPVDRRFTVSYTNVRASWSDRPMAYLRGDGYNGKVSGPQFNSTGGVNTLTRTGRGVYSVRLPGLGLGTGHVQVTAWHIWPLACSVTGWGPAGVDQIVTVRCFDPTTGAAHDSLFTLTYVDTLNALGLSTGFTPDGHDSAYAWADQSSTPLDVTYTPNTSYQFTNGVLDAATASRVGTGDYVMRFPDVDVRMGNVQVTMYGWAFGYCGVVSWTTSAGIRVRCYDAAGQPVDSRFDVAFTGPFVVG